MITESYLKEKLLPLGYHLDGSQEHPTFIKLLPHKDATSPYAFTFIVMTLGKYSLSIEGMNERLIRKAIRAGAITISSPEDVEALKEVIFEATLEESNRLERILPFLHEQSEVLQSEPPESEAFEKALANIKLLVDAAAQVE